MRVTSSPPTPSTRPPAIADGARVLSRRPLRYDDGADATRDRPAHVRAGSGCAFIDIPGVGRRLAVVQDDAHFIALVDVDRDVGRGGVGAIELPAGPGGLRQFDSTRGNKKDKLDLEALVSLTVDGRPALLGIGSGSGGTARREHLVLCTFDDDGAATVEVFAGSAFYRELARKSFTGDERNLEGAVVVGDRLRLFNRGNGAGEARDAVGEVSLTQLLRHLRDPLLHAAPPLQQVQALHLGDVDGTRLTVTDAAVHPDGRTLFLAAAEASPNTWDDGEVKGTALGVLGKDGTTTLWPLLDEQGLALTDKVEGIAVDPTNPKRAFVVVDKDDPHAPADLLVVSLP
jgi:hypothetical protein